MIMGTIIAACVRVSGSRNDSGTRPSDPFPIVAQYFARGEVEDNLPVQIAPPSGDPGPTEKGAQDFDAVKGLRQKLRHDGALNGLGPDGRGNPDEAQSDDAGSKKARQQSNQADMQFRSGVIQKEPLTEPEPGHAVAAR